MGATPCVKSVIETTERPADVPLGDGDRDVAHSRSGWLSSRSTTTASTRLHCRPSVPVPLRPAERSALTPAVSYDGDLVVSRRTLAPGLVRRANAAPCVPLATVPAGTAVPHSQRRQHSRCEAPLRLTQSRRLCAITLSAHCQALTQLNFTSARLFHTAAAHCRIRVRSLARSTPKCRLSRNVFASPLKHVLFM